MGSTPAAERGWRRPTVSRDDLPGLVLAVAVCEAVGVTPALVTAPGSDAWYAAFAITGFAPPGWVFGTVWTALFALLGAAVYLVVRDGQGRPRVMAVGLFVGQFALNVAWTLVFVGGDPVFGGGDSAVVGFVLAVALLWGVVATTAAFSEVRLAAAALLAPYLTWVSFATYLNYALLALR